jgi:7-cyano-7-deazaguanine synthase
VRSALLLSGGMDSIALLWLERPELAITINYGQRAAPTEIQASAAACSASGTKHVCVHADCSSIGSGDMAGGEPLPHAPARDWWPYRNQLLATLAGPSALAYGCAELLFGTVVGDASHADGTPEFYTRLSALMQLQEGGIRVRAPAAELSTAELIRKSGVPREVLSWAHSCHVSSLACGHCRGCIKHYEVTGELYGEPF